MNFFAMKMSNSAVYIINNTGLMHYAYIQPEWKSQAYIHALQVNLNVVFITTMVLLSLVLSSQWIKL